MTAATNPVAPTSVPPLGADLDAALRRLKLATVRRNAAEVLQVAKTQRWTPEEVLRTLVEAEIASRDASNTANRLKAAAFPVTKALDGFDVAGSSVSQATFDYLQSLEWVRGQQNLAIIGRRRRESLAKQLCLDCPVVRRCRSYALATREPYGIWGATTPAEHRRLLDSGCDTDMQRALHPSDRGRHHLPFSFASPHDQQAGCACLVGHGAATRAPHRCIARAPAPPQRRLPVAAGHQAACR